MRTLKHTGLYSYRLLVCNSVLIDDVFENTQFTAGNVLNSTFNKSCTNSSYQDTNSQGRTLNTDCLSIRARSSADDNLTKLRGRKLKNDTYNKTHAGLHCICHSFRNKNKDRRRWKTLLTQISQISPTVTTLHEINTWMKLVHLF